MPDPHTPPRTPDGRYIVVRGRLWRAMRPDLSERNRVALTGRLMEARREIARAKRAGDAVEIARLRRDVDRAKIELGERGPVWWTDGAPDFNRRMARNTPYASWYAALGDSHEAER